MFTKSLEPSLQITFLDLGLRGTCPDHALCFPDIRIPNGTYPAWYAIVIRSHLLHKALGFSPASQHIGTYSQYLVPRYTQYRYHR